MLSQLRNKSTSSCVLTKQAAHGPESKLQWAIMNNREHKSSCTDVLCDDVVPFRLRLKNLSPDCNRTAFPFLSNVIRVKINSKQTSKRQTGQKPRKRAKMKKRGPKLLKKLRGAANVQSSQKMLIFHACNWNQDAFSHSSRTQPYLTMVANRVNLPN